MDTYWNNKTFYCDLLLSVVYELDFCALLSLTTETGRLFFFSETREIVAAVEKRI